MLLSACVSEWTQLCIVQEMEKKADELKSADHELRKEISHRKQEIKTLKEDLANAVRQNQLLMEELDSVKTQIRSSKVNFYSTTSPQKSSLQLQWWGPRSQNTEKTWNSYNWVQHICVQKSVEI